jgi:glucokinase
MYIVVDIGGTKTRIAGSRDLETFGDPIIVPTESVYDEGIARISEAALRIASGESIEGCVAGVRGILTRGKRSIYSDAKISAWAGKPLADDLESRLHTRVALENDTALVGLGEAVHGAGARASIVAYITVSTGVGGARIVNGVIDRAAIGFEIGHQYLSIIPPVELEDMVSGSAVQTMHGIPPQSLSEDAREWETLAVTLAYGLYNTTLHWSPDRFVLGGSMFNKIGIHIERTRATLKTLLARFPESPDLVHARLGDVGGLWGGVVYLRNASRARD